MARNVPIAPPTERASDTATGLVFDIKRYAVHDGPGIRTTVFLKGCSLRCVWCHNPEAIAHGPEVFFYPDRCIACGSCVEACPTGAQTLADDGHRTFDRSTCDLSLQCVDVCNSNALMLAGKQLTVDEVMDEVREDATFYRVSGGGVTLSGGEPLLQNEFATALLNACNAEGFHTSLDSCGQVPWSFYERALPYVDLVLYDLKHIHADSHKEFTGASNRRIIQNLRKLNERGTPVEIRMLIVPTVNDSEEQVGQAAEFLAGMDNITAVRLLAYHSMAVSKYTSLGKDSTMPDVESPDTDAMAKVAEWVRGYGLTVITPSDDA
ncbi:MAG: glycyl-radical enzyme activating protein [SAR202 cluster bacterium]|jgi:pyruvate formate lyase activating enzyme|nr:glycyl-radical enzyme activating protein [Chloroflexota bacterium]MDP6422662.1 glycyl-radical enzyme activating protein [SAR202 cluster bacterium]HAL48109.1 glycyl-radical enzyme activating protein [Dehalococcoidia bacterium]MDP6663516.1 glycyl-radical enzyme activating protein [SAR202 cluster bacterium]MQG59200.1 glycyl-radical enzyme activating protein [SAR202 cluster bacterium]|tara:strand:- start:1966 stop:2931 length:966 start_codon:yes stop_codon:yes gene_type:complete